MSRARNMAAGGLLLLLTAGCAGSSTLLPSSLGSLPERPPSPEPQTRSGNSVRLVPVASWGGPGSDPGQFRDPGGLSVDFRGDLYVADTGNDRVQRLSVRGDPLEVVGSAGSGARRFSRPVDVVASLSFNLFVSDSENERIQSFDLEGNFTGFLPAEEGTLSEPWGLALSPDGRLFVADRDEHRVLIVDPQGEVRGTMGTLGSGPAQLRQPTFLAADETRLLVSDTGNARIAIFDLNGAWRGSWTGFTEPLGIAEGREGEVYVADGRSGRIRVLDPWGRELAAAGAGAGEASGPRRPTGLALAPGGFLYVSDRDAQGIFVYRVEYRKAETSAPGTGP